MQEMEGMDRKPRVYVMKAGSLPEGTWQRDILMDDTPGGDDLPENKHLYYFLSVPGQGRMYLQTEPGARAVILSINGCGIQPEEITAPGVYEIDYSEVARIGINHVHFMVYEQQGCHPSARLLIPYPEVIPGYPEEAGIAPLGFDLIEDILETDIRMGFPGGQLAVVSEGRLIYSKAFGATCAYGEDGKLLPNPVPATTETLYDLASVTKMFSVNYPIQKLITDKKLSLQDTISSILGESFSEDTIYIPYPELSEMDPQPTLEDIRAWKRSLTVRDLLCHQGGFVPDPQYHNPCFDAAKRCFDSSAHNELFSGNDGSMETREETFRQICRTPLFYRPGTRTVYSDVDYMILGFVVEKVTGERLDRYLQREFLDPLELRHVTFRPLDHGFTKEQCAATELHGNTRDGAIDWPGIRRHTLQGEVHDEKAYYAMAGISGHAGLFGNAEDLAKLLYIMLTGGYGVHRFFSRAVIDLFSAPKDLDHADWGLGWWRQGDMQRGYWFGHLADENAIGHSGWTGTLIMADSTMDLVVVYLTNKINSPVTNRDTNPNRFDGSYFTAGQPGFVGEILNLCYLPEDEVEDLMDYLNEIHHEATLHGLSHAGTPHPSWKNALSKHLILEKWSNSDFT
ncbi:MAG: penicillin binding protein PBP4B [Clostridia bacterium]|nr:penicillin binding protein PBP4B [Clostridia bacterium]